MSIFAEFKKFAMRGNVVDLAVGVVIGAAFTGIVNSLVNDVIMPPIGWATGGVDFSNLFVVLKGDRSVETLAAAKAAKDVTINYGLFVNTVINFLIVAIALFVCAGLLSRGLSGTAAGDQIAALFGAFAIGWGGYVAMLALIGVIAGVTAFTSRHTVNRTLATIG